jgi:antitoxin component of MazEF toxin-antitoxin module
MSNIVRVQQHPTGQLTVTLPRALAVALRIRKGDEMEWLLEDGRLVLVRVRKK